MHHYQNTYSRYITTLVIGVVSAIGAKAQTTFLRGKITSAASSLQGATVSVDGRNSTVTDAAGDYKINVAAGEHSVTVTYVGYESQTQQINAKGAATLDFVLQPVADLDAITVVGIRNPKRSATESPVPIDVIQIKQIVNQVGQLDLDQLLTYLAPSFNSVRQALGDATDQTDPAQLRGLGPDQVLVLVNGKRYHQSSLVNVNGTVNKGTTGTDLNSIPASAIDHIEILRDGASAQYGSDAIAGVINIVLKKNTRFSLTTSFGENATGYDKNYAWNILHPSQSLPGHVNATDGQNYQIGANYGVPMKKGYLELSAEFLRRNASNRTGLYTGQVWPLVNGVDESDQIDQQKGVTRDKYDLRVGNSQITGGGAVLNFAYPISRNLEVYAVGIGNIKQGNAGGLYRYPYKLTTSANGGSFPSSDANSANAAAIVAQLYPYGFLPLEEDKIQDYNVTAGIRGHLSTWNVDLSETYGYNSIRYGVSNSVNYTQAYVPSITANQLQTSFNSGTTKLYQSTANLDVNNNFAHVLQGLNVAAGAEFRADGYGIVAGEPNSYLNFSTDNGLIGIAGAQVFSGFLPSNAGNWNRTSYAVYTDDELDITKQFLISGALRYEHYSDFGGTLNYKFAARYKLTDWLALRASTSSGFRAPSLAQEYYSKVTTQFVTPPGGGALVPIQAGTFTNNSQIAQILGIPKLKQETSHSYSVGATANITDGLDLTIDAYQIDIKNRIILSNSFSGGSITTLLNSVGAGSASVFANAIDTRSRGIEGVLSYTKNFDKDNSLTVSLAHSTNVNKVRRDANGNLIIHASQVLENAGLVSSYFNRADESRIETYTPRNKDILTIQYRYKKIGVLARVSYFGSVQYLNDTTGAAHALATNTSGGNYAINAFDNNKLDLTDQTFGGKFLSDIALSYSASKAITINIGVNNLFNVYPDKLFNFANTNNGTFVYSRSVSQFGYNGRYIFAKLNINL